MKNPYYAGRFVMNTNLAFNYKNIIGGIISTAKNCNSDYILLNSDNCSANTILNEFNKFKIEAEWASMNGETLICIPMNDTLVKMAKSNGINI